MFLTTRVIQYPNSINYLQAQETESSVHTSVGLPVQNKHDDNGSAIVKYVCSCSAAAVALVVGCNAKMRGKCTDTNKCLINLIVLVSGNGGGVQCPCDGYVQCTQVLCAHGSREYCRARVLASMCCAGRRMVGGGGL